MTFVAFAPRLAGLQLPLAHLQTFGSYAPNTRLSEENRIIVETAPLEVGIVNNGFLGAVMQMLEYNIVKVANSVEPRCWRRLKISSR